MNKHGTTMIKGLLAAGVCGLGLWTGGALAHGEHAGHQARELDRRGDRIERRLDRKGDRIERRLQRRAEQLRAEGRWAEASRLAREGHRINRYLDRKGERINRSLDRQAQRLRDSWRHGYRADRVHDHRDYRPPHHHDHHETLVLAFDLGSWVIRP